MDLPSIEKADIRSKRVLLRGDIDVPLARKRGTENEGLSIGDDTRLQAIWPGIDYLLNRGCHVTLCGHIGRPYGEVVPGLSTKTIANWLENRGGNTVGVAKPEKVNNFTGFRISQQLVVLENLRFDPREEANIESFVTELAALGQIYVNDAFASCERSHASITGVPKILPHYAGMRLVKEVENLGGVTKNPKRPLVVILGGAKMETKIPLINRMGDVADRIIIAGKLLEECKPDMVFPGNKQIFLELTTEKKDTTLESIDAVRGVLETAGTIVWNGPLGEVENYTYQVGTRRLAEIIANLGAFKVVGGGDTLGFLNKLGLTGRFDWASIGGGAMLKFLAGEELPGIRALLS